MNNIPASTPLSLYIHIPWCVKKCPYCDFNSHEPAGALPENEYIEMLLWDLDQELVVESRRQLVSIFIGGGTPSLFSPEAVDRLLGKIRNQFDTTDIEITMEANPGTYDAANFAGYRQAGVNRLSIGAQSFSNDALKALGRIHESEEILKAFEGARKAGFERINLDLMHGLPDQNGDAAMQDLEQAIALSPEHLSWYQLTIEPNTYFHRYTPILPDEDTLAGINTSGHKALAAAGYGQYEVSAYAKPGEQAQHNLNYWQFGDYLGIGAGAHGKLTRGHQIIRTTKTRAPRDYLAAPGGTSKAIEQSELALEFLMNALRLNDGFSLSLFESRTGFSASRLDSFIASAVDLGLIECVDSVVKPTELGRRYLTDLLMLVE